MNLVGRSRVSAITHTPASGPFALVTTPPRESAPTLMPGGVGAWAPICGVANSPTTASAATLANNAADFFISGPPACKHVTSPACGGEVGERSSPGGGLTTSPRLAEGPLPTLSRKREREMLPRQRVGAELEL